jgi:TRAP transporter 4TM/12TM fusion protein
MSEQPPALTAKYRPLSGPVRWIFILFSLAAISSAVFYNFYLSLEGWTFDQTGYLFFLLGLFLPLVFLVFPATKNAPRHKTPWYEYLASILTVISCGYCFIHSMDILTQGWEVRAPWEAKILSLILLVLVLEAARRTGGLMFCLVCLFFGAYPLFAEYMPAFLQGKSFPFWRVVTYQALGPESIIGLPLRVVGTVLIGFMIFAVALQHTGAGKFFLDLALALLGTVRGGAAKVSIFSSALMGSVSGSVISNVISTGSFTIPAMKKTGYSPEFAGAVEACASAGGVIMPPIMGATAFVMAEVLQVPYVAIITAAAVPSCLYYFCLFYQADAYAALNNIKGQARKDCPNLWEVLKGGWFYLVALALLIFIVVFMYRESQAAWITTLVLLALAMLRKETRLNLKKFLNLLEGSGRFMAELTAILAACGLIIGSMSVTGVAHSFAHEVVNFAGDNVLLLLVLGALASFILGMGMTITACYIFLAIVMVPALVQAGYYPLAVHLFVLYWGVASFITPPVALGAFAASTVAGSNPMRTGFQAMRLGLAKYFLPFFFVFNPALILHGTPLAILHAVFSCVIGIALLGSALEGYLIGVGKMPRWSRPFLFMAGIALGFPEGYSDIGGFVLALMVVLVALPGIKKRAPAGVLTKNGEGV